MKERTDSKGQIWTVLLLVTPVVSLMKLSDEFGVSSLNRILLAVLFGGVGGLIGAGLFQLVKTKSTFIKTISILILTGFCITTLFVAYKYRKVGLQTCEVCGFIAVASDKKECGYCGTWTWDEQKKIIGYGDKQVWLRDEQLFWFSIDSITQPIDFYHPDSDEGFEKDKNWKPIITQQELINDFSKEK